MTTTPSKQKPTLARPAETTTLALGAGDFIAWRLGLPDGTAAMIGLALSTVPAAVTALVTHGGIKGLITAIWSGQH